MNECKNLQLIPRCLCIWNTKQNAQPEKLIWRKLWHSRILSQCQELVPLLWHSIWEFCVSFKKCFYTVQNESSMGNQKSKSGPSFISSVLHNHSVLNLLNLRFYITNVSKMPFSEGLIKYLTIYHWSWSVIYLKMHV